MTEVFDAAKAMSKGIQEAQDNITLRSIRHTEKIKGVDREPPFIELATGQTSIYLTSEQSKQLGLRLYQLSTQED